ncbi:C45 family autoproteolytic acyltransferase/hydolase [Candidatus Harpocratesius sp.]
MRKKAEKPPRIRKRHFRRGWRHTHAQLNQLLIKSFLSSKEKHNSAEWHESNSQKYLEIKASDYYSLGLIEGTELGSKIRALKIIIKAIAAKTRHSGYDYNRFLEMAHEYENSIPDEYLRDSEKIGTFIDEVQGMADALKGITFEDVFLQNCFIDIVYGELIPFGAKIPQDYEFGCTSIGFYQNKQIIEQPSIFIGQNFDFNLTFKPTLSFVLHKVAHHPRIFSLRMGGMLALPTGLNEWGLRTCINVVKSTVSAGYTIPSGVLARLIFTYCFDTESAYKMAYQQPASNGYNLMIGDFRQLVVCETLPQEHNRYDIESWFVTSNTFIDAKFQQYLLLPNYSKERQRVAELMAEETYQSGVHIKSILEILSKKPIICRNSLNVAESRTLAFISNDYFGLGNPADHPWGFIPIEAKDSKKKEFH